MARDKQRTFTGHYQRILFRGLSESAAVENILKDSPCWRILVSFLCVCALSIENTMFCVPYMQPPQKHLPSGIRREASRVDFKKTVKEEGLKNHPSKVTESMVPNSTDSTGKGLTADLVKLGNLGSERIKQCEKSAKLVSREQQSPWNRLSFIFHFFCLPVSSLWSSSWLVSF